MSIQILDEAEDDLHDGREFYDRQAPRVGDYFAAALASDIESLIHWSLVFIAPCRNASLSASTISWGTPSSASMPCSICGVIPPGFAEG